MVHSENAQLYIRHLPIQRRDLQKAVIDLVEESNPDLSVDCYLVDILSHVLLPFTPSAYDAPIPPPVDYSQLLTEFYEN